MVSWMLSRHTYHFSDHKRSLGAFGNQDSADSTSEGLTLRWRAQQRKENTKQQRGHHRPQFSCTLCQGEELCSVFVSTHAVCACHVCQYPFLRLSTPGRHFNPHCRWESVALQNVKPRSITYQHSGAFLSLCLSNILEGQKLVRNFRSHRNDQQREILKICQSSYSMLNVL